MVFIKHSIASGELELKKNIRYFLFSGDTVYDEEEMTRGDDLEISSWSEGDSSVQFITPECSVHSVVSVSDTEIVRKYVSVEGGGRVACILQYNMICNVIFKVLEH